MSSEDPLALLATTPSTEYSLFELGVEWHQLSDVEAHLAAAVRVFVITRDPLDWLPDRGGVFATVNGAAEDALELVIYITRQELDRRIEAAGGDHATALGLLGESVVRVASTVQGVVLAGGYPELAFLEEVPGLLSAPVRTPGFGQPDVSAVSTEWEPMGLAAIQDFVQEAFGPVDLDRAPVALRPVQPPQRGCPACLGVRFGFPGDLTEGQRAMCPEHRAEAAAETTSRIARARTSNPAGWRAIAKASARTSGLPEPPAGPVPQRRAAAPGRNDPCPCGSGRKYKQCCGR